MRTVPSGDAGDALERLQDEQWHILELFDTYAHHQRDPARRVPEAERLATLIHTLLRVHCELQGMLLHAASRHEAGAAAALARAQARREGLLEALELAQASSPGDPARVRTMTELAQCARSSFHADEQELFACVRRSRLDLAALDQDMAMRQEALLSAGKNAAHVSSVPIVPTAKASGQAAG